MERRSTLNKNKKKSQSSITQFLCEETAQSNIVEKKQKVENDYQQNERGETNFNNSNLNQNNNSINTDNSKNLNQNNRNCSNESNLNSNSLKISNLINNKISANKNPHLGAFFHWGLYSIYAYVPKHKAEGNGAEWYLKRTQNTFMYGDATLKYHKEHWQNIDYYSKLDEFEARASKCDFDQWADLLHKQHVSYAILTVKHHDGISLYPSAVRNSTHLCFSHFDAIAKFKSAMEARGILFGVYYSLLEWTDLYGNGRSRTKVAAYVDKVLIPQMKEIVTRFQPAIFWADGHWAQIAGAWKSYHFLDWLHRFNPRIIVNDRWGTDFVAKPRYNVRYNFKDRFLPENNDPPLQKPWEHINSISSSWGYAQPDCVSYKNSRELQDLYIRVRKNGGHFCINFAPDPDGRISQEQQAAFLSANFPCEEIGKNVKV